MLNNIYKLVAAGITRDIAFAFKMCQRRWSDSSSIQFDSILLDYIFNTLNNKQTKKK